MKLITLSLMLMLLAITSSARAEEPSVIFKNQKKSHIKWGTLNEKEFLNIEQWIYHQDLKDQSPEWETLLRERTNQEMVGKVLHCVGICRLDKGDGFTRPQYRSKLYEGEEIYTEKESYLWFFLLDGTIVRLSPESSVTVVEFNLTEKGFFVFLRVNYGHMMYLSRTESGVKEDNERETDVTFFPLPSYQAMVESETINYKENDLINFLVESDKNLKHKKALNERILKNNEFIKNKKTYSFVVFPTGTVEGYDMAIEVISHFGEETYLKGKNHESLDVNQEDWAELTLTLRGLENFETKVLPRGVWYKINSRGRELAELEDDFWPRSGEFVTRRITSIFHMREEMLEENSRNLFQDKLDRTEMARDYGFRIWGELSLDMLDGNSESNSEKLSDSTRRLKFLREYTRRLETSNILVGEKFKEKLEKRGDRIDLKKYGNRYFSEALRRYMIYNPSVLSDEDRFDKNSTEKMLWKKKYGIK